MLMIETLNVTLVTYLGGFIQYWPHKNILVVLWASWFLQIANRMLVIKATFLVNKASYILRGNSLNSNHMKFCMIKIGKGVFIKVHKFPIYQL